MSAAGAAPGGTRFLKSVGKRIREFGMPLVFTVCILVTAFIHPNFGSFDLQSLALGALPLAMAAVAQAIVVISGGIDLSVGSMIAVANVLSARLMLHVSFEQSLWLAVLVLAIGALMGAANGILVAITRIPDVVVTLTTGFIWGGVALLILERPGGGAPAEFLNLAAGIDVSEWLPNAFIVMVAVVALIWIPIRYSRIGLLLYAAGSDPVAAFRSGVNINVARTLAYTFGGLACAAGGMSLTMTTGIGAPLAGTYYTLSSVAAAVIGGVRLTGGHGGMVGPVAAALLLTLIPMDLIFLNIDPNYGQVIQGTLIVLVVMFGGFVTFMQKRK